jgi:eukaryotic-like serine/threonine-protein kinase
METPSAAHDGGLLPAGVRPLRPGDPAELGGHRLVARLGSGGMGVVYLGRDPLDGLVAVKSAHGGTADAELAQRFAAEADCLRRLPEGCTARLIKDGTTRTPPYLVTEYVEGRSLAHVVDTGGPLPPEQVRAVATGVLRALAAVHRAGLVHRDVKPPNIVLTVCGPRLIDFGIAQQVGASGGPTGPETVMGSPGWISPERLNRQPAGPASDVFGWGCLAVYAATGHNPFGRADAEELARRILTEPPDLDGVEAPLRDLVAEALAKDPAARPSAEDLLARIGGVADDRRAPATAEVDEAAVAVEGPGATSAATVAPVSGVRRHWPALAAAGVAAVTALTAIVVTRGADHDVARTPPSGVPSAHPDDRAAIRATQRAPMARPRSPRPITRPGVPSERHSTRPDTPSGTPSDAPVTVPSIAGPSLPAVLQSGKDKSSGGPARRDTNDTGGAGGLGGVGEIVDVG